MYLNVNSRHKAIQIIGQRKAFYKQIIPESSCARKETVDIDIFLRSRNRVKNHAIYQKNKQNSRENKEVEPAEPVQKNIYQSNTYRKDLNWLHFKNGPRAQESQQVKAQQYLHICFCSLSNNSKQQLKASAQT